MQKNLSSAVRQAGKAYCRNQKVQVVTRQEHGGHSVELQGKVLCSFGFVHHPRLRVVSIEGQAFIVDYSCDCYEYSDGSGFCGHCAALALHTFGDGELTYEQKTGVPRSDAAFSAEPDERSAEILSDEQNEEGQRSVKGKTVSSFGFIHYPQLSLCASEVADYSCDCYQFADTGAFCTHCRALLNRVQNCRPAEEPASPGEEPESPMEEPAPSQLEGDFSAETIEEPAGEAVTFEPVEEPVTFEGDEEPVTFEPAGEVAAVTPDEETAAEPPEEPSAAEAPAVPEALDWDGQPRTMRVLFGRTLDEERPVCWYPNDTSCIFHPNMGIIGTMGTGKTQLTKSVVTQLCRQQRSNYDGRPLGILIFDYKGDYNETKPEFIRATGARVYKPYRLPFNPFSLQNVRRKPQLPIHVANAFTNNIARIYGLGPKQTATLLRCIVSAYQACGVEVSDPATWEKAAPTFAQVYQLYCGDESIKKNDSLYAAMEKLFQFQLLESDPQRTASLFSLLNGVVVIDLSGYDSDIQNLVVAITLELFYSQMQNSGSSKADERFRQLTRFILVDEADNFMSQNFPALKRILKEGREFGVGTILSTQSLRHFASGEDYSSYILTWLVHNVPDLKRSDIEFVFKTSADPDVSAQLYQQIKMIGKHQSVVKAGNAAPVSMQDLPFWQIADDADESYLPPEIPEN